ncbi:MAG: hypothetical protein K0Q77_844 [Anaerosporomusa subterranea]|nr:hypothetical protein [Anaerosporomusa subterranea]
MDIYEKSLMLHKQMRGKIAVATKMTAVNQEDLGLLYSPGVAEPCRRIAIDQQAVYDYTAKGNMVAVISDGSAVLGLGNIGPKAAIPVMEGKALLFKNLAGVDAFPICLDTQVRKKSLRQLNTCLQLSGRSISKTFLLPSALRSKRD